MITSRQNALIKEIKALEDKKYRDKTGKYIVESVKTVNEAIFCKEQIELIVGTSKGLSFLCDKSLKQEEVSEELFSYISTEVSPQGLLAIVKKPTREFVEPKDSCIFLDGISDPSNMGAIIRTAAASDYKEIYIDKDCCDPYSPKSVRSSMGGLFRVNIIRIDKKEFLNKIKFPIIVADMKGENVFNFKIKEKFCLAIGNEAHGISDILSKSAKYVLSIPMQNGVESLNASVSAGILMYSLKTICK